VSRRRGAQEQEAVKEKGMGKEAEGAEWEESVRRSYREAQERVWQAAKRKREEMEEQAEATKEKEKGKWKGSETGIGAKRGQKKGSPLRQMWNAGDDDDEEIRRSLSVFRFSK